jgi:ABC-type oligopeptide transport system substrate-binding subunit
MLAEDYFGPATSSPEFQSGFYRGYYYTPRMSLVVWNLKRPQFADVKVRNALALAFDWNELIRSFYYGWASA